jgi:hypothetical protein
METARGADREEALDVTLGLGASVFSATRLVFAAARPVVAFALRPPLVPPGISPQAGLDAVARTGRRVRAQFNPLLDRVVPPIAAAVLDRVDVNQVVARADINAVVDRVDIAGIVRQALDEIDLPEIIRESSGSLASESVVGMRMQGIAADERVNRIVDKILLRREGRKTTQRPMPAHPGSGDDT